MINNNLPEPPSDCRFCIWCGRSDHLHGELVHWPSADYDEPTVKMRDGEIEPFSHWHYTCESCRAAEERRRDRQKDGEAK